MKAIEAIRTRDKIIRHILKKGMPINIRKGSDEEIAKWVGSLFDDYVTIDEPLGVIRGTDYDRCPSCNGVAGQSAYYCKLCGAKLRAGGRERG